MTARQLIEALQRQKLASGADPDVYFVTPGGIPCKIQMVTFFSAEDQAPASLHAVSPAIFLAQRKADA